MVNRLFRRGFWLRCVSLDAICDGLNAVSQRTHIFHHIQQELDFAHILSFLYQRQAGTFGIPKAVRML